MISNKEFFEWHNDDVFGYGYGTGEWHTCTSLKNFQDCLGKDTSVKNGYSYLVLEDKLGQQVAWLLINALCKTGILEYGTSARCGWLTEKGVSIFDFMKDKTVEQLYEIVTNYKEYN